jgi:hypothetical protein
MATLRSFARSTCALELSPLIAAIMDASAGLRPTTIDDDESVRHFGCTLDGLPSTPLRTIAVRAGGRGGKTSRLLAPKALHAAWTVPLPTVRRGEVASALIVAPDLKLARQALSFVTGYVEGSRVLTRALVEPPTKDAVELRRPDGKRVRIEVLAASRGGRGVRGRTLVFAGLDEAAFFFDETTGVVNDADVYRAVLQRVVPGGQVWIVSTPWLADTGLLETLIAKNWGTHANALAATAPTRALNPSWDPTGEVERDMREQDPDAAVREIDGEPMTGGAGNLLDPAAVDDCVDDSLSIPCRPSSRASAGGDVAFVRDPAALCITERRGNHVVILALEERRPARGAPLKPSELAADFGEIAKSYRVNTIACDRHYSEALREHLATLGVRLVHGPDGQAGKTEVFLLLRQLVNERRLRIPRHARLIGQLKSLISRPTPGGGLQITSPRRGGGHGDLCSALTLSIWNLPRARARVLGGAVHPGASFDEMPLGPFPEMHLGEFPS